MLSEQTIDRLSAAVTALDENPASTGAWQALPALARLGQEAATFVIDYRASQNVGAPVILVRPTADLDQWFTALTPRQRQVARHIIAGQPNKQIAHELGITVATVKDHVHAVLQRLGLSSRAALIAAAQSV